MRPRRHITALREPVLRRLASVSSRFALARTQGKAARDERAVAYAVIELQNIWAEFARALFISYALRGRDPSGRPVSHGIPNIHDATEALIEAATLFDPDVRKRRFRRRDEPQWHVRTTLIRIVRHFAFSNTDQILAGLAVRTRVFDDLPRVRNFYAHKGADSCRTALAIGKSYGLGHPAHPTDVVLGIGSKRPHSVGEDWVSDLRDIVEGLT